MLKFHLMLVKVCQLMEIGGEMYMGSGPFQATISTN